MSKVTGILVFLLFASLLNFSQTESSKKLFPFKSGNKCGYINQEGKIVISPEFEFCDVFSEGLAGVSLSKKDGYIDETGKIVIPLQFDYLSSDSFYEGLASITLPINEKGIRERGFVDKLGNVKLLEGISEAYSFCEGLALVKKNEKYGYIDKNMKFVIPPKFYFASSFDSGRAAVLDISEDKSGNKSGKHYYIDTSGRKVIDCDAKFCSGFSEGLAMIENKYGQYGYIDTNGKVVIKPHSNYGVNFKEGLSRVRDYHGKWGYIDKTGQFVIQPQFDEAEDFSPDGIAVVKVGEKYGFINKKGEFTIAPQFDKAEWLDGLGLVEVNGVKKYVNEQGKTIFVLNGDAN